MCILELQGTSKEVPYNNQRRSPVQKSKSLVEAVKPVRTNSLSNLATTKINPRAHSTKGISKVGMIIELYITINYVRLKNIIFILYYIIYLCYISFSGKN